MIDEGQLVNGIWYQDWQNPIFVNGLQVSFIRVFGYANRQNVMELSTYPRAYHDTDPHQYQVDTPFVVGINDCNIYYDPAGASMGAYQLREDVLPNEQVYLDSRGNIFKVGKTAVHFAGETLPGSFPYWIASESLANPRWIDTKNCVFPYVRDFLKGTLREAHFLEAWYKEESQVHWTQIATVSLAALEQQFLADTTGKMTTGKLVKNKDRFIVRILYEMRYV